MSGHGPRLNQELPTCNRTISLLNLQRRHEAHQQRLRDIAGGGRRAALGNRWREGPHKSKPEYRHLRQNLKRAQMQSERYDTIEHENRLLLSKMSALMAPGSSVLDPTAGTWEFQPGVRLNRNQMPVIVRGRAASPHSSAAPCTATSRSPIRRAALTLALAPPQDHGISTAPTMPQKGAAREPESLNLGARRRELERITHENRGIVQRIQDRSSQFGRAEWSRRSEELDRQLLLLRRPVCGVWMAPRLAAPLGPMRPPIGD